MSKLPSDPADDELVVEVNEKQAMFLQAVYSNRFKIAAMIGGRGSGKSITLSDFLLLAMDELPGGKCGWGVPYVKKAKSKLSSSLKAGWKRHGIKPYDFATGEGCYALWREPPPHFERAYEAPDVWDNCISFPNGFMIEFEGFKMAAGENRGSNFDLYVIDEALNFKKDWLTVVLPTLRANEGKFTSNFHQMMAVFSSPPWEVEGQWIYDIEELAKSEPDKYFFINVKTRDNLAFLPADYLDTMRKSLTKLAFQVEVEGVKLTKMPHNFYPSFQHHIHVVHDESMDHDDRAAWDNGEMLYSAVHGLEISLDFNAHFTSATLWQSDMVQARQVDNIYCKEPAIDADGVAMTMAQTLATQIVDAYADHKKKHAILTGDRNGKNKSAGSTKSMFEQVAEILEAAGWVVHTSALNYNPPHIDKFKDINTVFAEKNPQLFTIRMDGIRCKATIISMDNSPLNTDYTKNKHSEGSSMEQERATHLSDTVDYYIFWKLKGGSSVHDGDFDLDYF